MRTLTHPSTGDMDALDRGLVAVGQTAAEAIARVDAAEARLAELQAEVAFLRSRDGFYASVDRGLRYILKLAGHEDWETHRLTA